jgi:glycosyltransferase involved in cell wall biosynthesis
MIKLSIIIPVYNVSQYVRRCILSIIDQKNVRADVECIIVNDCTPDDSMDIVHCVIDDYSGSIHFVVCNHEVNKGLSAARNTGIMNATGDYVLFVDSDDYLNNDCLDLMIGGLEKYQNVDVVLGNAFSRKYNRPFFPPVSSPTLLTDTSEILLKVFFAELHFHAWNRLVRRDLLIENEIFFVEGLLYEDMPWSFKLLTTMSSMLVLPYNTYVYEYNESSIMNTTDEKINKVVNSFCYIINYILDNIYKNVRSDCRIYCFGILLRTIDMTNKYMCSNEMYKNLKSVKRRLISEAFFSGRLLMTLFFLTSLKPFVHIYTIPLIRRNYHKVTVLFSKIERTIDHLS